MNIDIELEYFSYSALLVFIFIIAIAIIIVIVIIIYLTPYFAVIVKNLLRSFSIATKIRFIVVILFMFWSSASHKATPAYK